MNRRAALGLGAGGLVPRRPDQASRQPQGVVIGPGSKNVIRARQVIISGPAGGEFVYDAAGNLRSANVGQTTTDPLQGITCQQGFSTFNGHGAVISLQATALDAFLLYTDTGTSTQGRLIASDTSAAGTDPFGNAFLAGNVGYSTAGATLLAVQISGGSGVQQAIRFYTATSAAGPWTAQGSIGADTGGNLYLVPGSLTGGVVIPSGTSAPASIAGDAILTALNNGTLAVVDGTDGSTYQTERLSLDLTSNFTINSTTPQTIFSAPLAIGRYEIDVWMVTSNTTAADAAGFAFAFTGTTLFALNDFESLTTGTATVGYGASATLTTTYNGQGVAGNQRVLMHMTLQVTVAGTLTLTGKELVAANTVTVFAGSRMRVYPVA